MHFILVAKKSLSVDEKQKEKKREKKEQCGHDLTRTPGHIVRHRNKTFSSKTVKTSSANNDAQLGTLLTCHSCTLSSTKDERKTFRNLTENRRQNGLRCCLEREADSRFNTQ